MNDFDKAMKKLRKTLGDSKVRTASEKLDISTIPTNIYDFDKNVLGIGGMPRGRLVEISGSESSGKSTLAEHLVASVQKGGGVAVIFDLEGTYDPIWGAKAGIDNEKLILPEVDHGEELYDQMMNLVGVVDLIVVDSVSAIISKGSASKAVDEPEALGLEANLNTKGLKKLINGRLDDKGKRITEKLSMTKTIIIFINQLRDNMMVVYGPKTRTSGGRALKHYASIRLEMSNPKYEKDGDHHTQRVSVKCTKNKLAPPLRSCEFYLTEDNKLLQDEGSIILNEAIDKGIVEQSGAWLKCKYFGEGKLHGKPKFDLWLSTADNQKEFLKILKDIKIKNGK